MFLILLLLIHLLLLLLDLLDFVLLDLLDFIILVLFLKLEKSLVKQLLIRVYANG